MFLFCWWMSHLGKTYIRKGARVTFCFLLLLQGGESSGNNSLAVVMTGES